MSIEIALLISIVSVCFSVFFGLKNNKRSDTKEIEARVKDNVTINLKLDNISKDTQEIKSEVASMRKEINAHAERLGKVEASASSAHKRIDGIENRLNGEEKYKND